jgi:hypothetical protein
LQKRLKKEANIIDFRQAGADIYMRIIAVFFHQACSGHSGPPFSGLLRIAGKKYVSTNDDESLMLASYF